MRSPLRLLLFVFFFVSGFSSLVYQVIWTRMAFAAFGILTPVLSIMISVFMLGLSVGAWLGGRSIDRLTNKTGTSAIIFYMLAELLIGVGALVTPRLFAAGARLLLSAGAMDSASYLALSGIILAVSVLPWTLCMGATVPFMMAYIRERDRQSTASFSFLYVANVLGAMTGTLMTALVLVELFGFQKTLYLAASGNFAIAIGSASLIRRNQLRSGQIGTPPESVEIENSASPIRHNQTLAKWILFSTGFTAMSMEVVWTRAFAPVLKTQIYSFALIVFSYLAATFVGSVLYRRALRAGAVWDPTKLISVAAVATFLPILANDSKLLEWLTQFSFYLPICALLLSIAPLCGVLGYLTPSLIDEQGEGDPAGAGKAYGLNVFGCILGPLFASYILLPCVGERFGLILLSLPLLAFYLLILRSLSVAHRLVSTVAIGAVSIYASFFTVDFAGALARNGAPLEIRRDYAATVISTGSNLDKRLLVNGVGVTRLMPETKFMAHLPLALHTGTPRSVLIICFGMGTTYRSALSWNVDTTAVELVPSVTRAFAFYHPDAASVLKNPNGHIVIDDGRRYLKRTEEKFDVISTDPPPPVEAAGSSLLYSQEFYGLVKNHLKENGIVQVWYPGSEAAIGQAILRSLTNSFSHVYCFRGVKQGGIHFLASMEPIPYRDSTQIASIMPPAAAADLLEWAPPTSLDDYTNQVLLAQYATDALLNSNPSIRITDDRPYNEYFFLRRWRLF